MKDGQTVSKTAASVFARPSSTLVIGLGNPILGDDGVGWKVAEQVRRCTEMEARFHLPIRPMGSKTVQHAPAVEVDCVALGGISLMERMIGYQRVILIDSVVTGQNPAGSVGVFPLSALSDPGAGHTSSAHDSSLMTALQTARTMELPVPDCIDIVAIEAKNVYDFSEELSQPVAGAVPVAVKAVMDLLSKEEP